jgi:hypothetical protein
MLVLGDLSPHKSRQWLCRVAATSRKPKLLMEFWDPYWIMKNTGPMTKLQVTKWSETGSSSACRTLNGLQVGGVVDRSWLVVVRTNDDTWGPWVWPDFHDAVIRPMSNCLRPTGIPRAAYKSHPSDPPEDTCPRSDVDSMPARPGSLITTRQGTRRLLNDELAKGLGTPKGWLMDHYPDGRALIQTVLLHVLEGLSPALLHADAYAQPVPAPDHVESTDPIPTPAAEGPSFEWKPPDLSYGSPWYKARVADLVAASCTFPDPAPLIEEGLESLRTHRSNYDDAGPSPTKLQLLWWMFPKEHWVELHKGCSMNFLVEPRCETTPDSEMDEEQIVIGEEFLDELVSLGVLIKVAPGEMVANVPLFCLPKPGQPGQWRILSDMRRGGQNEAIGADPTVFPKSGSILEQLYTGGYSAVIDASKFFYHLFYVYAGLPMGAGNSPSIAGQYGAAFLRLLRSKSDLYQGRPNYNTWWGAYQRGTPFNPNLGQGRVLIGADGIPAALCKGHCDDFLVHGPTYDKTFRALTAFLNCAVDVGLLCHPGKLTPPAHVVKYTGLLFDTVREPILRIPPYKIDKALAMIDYILDHGNHLFRLSLAVVVGVLESLVEATPTRVGHTFLRHLHENLHPPDWEGSDLPYFSFTTLDERDI